MARTKKERPQFWTKEECSEAVRPYAPNLGLRVLIGGGGENEVTEGRITSVIPYKADRLVYYRIVIPHPLKGDPYNTRTVSRVVTSADITFLDKDKEYLRMQHAYSERLARKAAKVVNSPMERVMQLEADIITTRGKIDRLNELLAKQLDKLTEARIALDEALM